MSAQDTEQVVRLLEQAGVDALAAQMVAVTIELVDQDGTVWLYRWVPMPGAKPPRVIGPVARFVQ
jgi:alpha-D-ribose 1-methylphosphonate 5-triphosphate synthase subunit PhnH